MCLFCDPGPANFQSAGKVPYKWDVRTVHTYTRTHTAIRYAGAALLLSAQITPRTKKARPAITATLPWKLVHLHRKVHRDSATGSGTEIVRVSSYTCQSVQYNSSTE